MDLQKEKETQHFLNRRTYLSLESAIEHAGFGKAQYKLLAMAGALFFTTVQTVHLGSLILPSLTCEWRLTKWQVLLLLGTGSLAMTIGAFVGNFSCHAFGRRKNVVGGMLFMLLFGFASVVQSNFYWYLTLRAFSFTFFQFVGSNAICAILEVCPKEKRLAVTTVLTVAGQLGATCSVFIAMNALHSMGWRKLTCILYIPCFIPLFCFLFYLEDSFRHLEKTGRSVEGYLVMSKMFKENNKEDLSHLISWKMDYKRDYFKDLLSPESETTTTLLLAVLTIKNIVVTTLHTAIPYILHGNYSIYEDVGSSWNSTESAECVGLSAETLGSLTKGQIIGIIITLAALSLSQFAGRSWSAFLCYLTATAAFITSIWWRGDQKGVVLKMTMAKSLVQGSHVMAILFIQAIFPISSQGALGEFFLSLGHSLSTAAPYLSIYVAVRHELHFFVVGSVSIAVFTGLLFGAKCTNGKKTASRDEIEKNYEWDVLHDYDSE